ncbi:MAG TPA: cytochrome c4 [Gammaproteobacteria bacterium]|jgi:cytochrome c553|nr:cytochrome c4 [Gammaproteobacteria bacterium]HIK72935.1 cytochrome c4 [Gammaproteobacteria bacterium]
MRLRLLIILAASLVTIGAGNADSGKDKVATCAACHGQDGNSMVGLWPSLAGQNVNYLVRQLQHIKSGKRPITEMIGSLDNFSQEDLEDIAAFYASQNNAIGQAASDKVELGRKLYYSGSLEKGVPACTACHSPKGKGNSPAGYPLLSGQQSDYIAKALKNYRTGERNNDESSQMMMAIAYKLDDVEIDALSSFINGLH